MEKRDVRRKFGQNYLSDPAIIFEMGQAIAPYSGNKFLEVGPGLGALTKTLNHPGIKLKPLMLIKVILIFYQKTFKALLSLTLFMMIY